jgi:minor histocompatibility antigen H13
MSSEVEVDNQRSSRAGMAVKVASAALIGLTLMPLVVKVNPNFNVVATACLTVFIGCHRSVKPAPPSETMSKEHAMRFPFIGSAVLLSLFLLFKFLPKDLINTVLTLYFFVLGVLALSATILPALERFLPPEWNDHLITWRLPYFKNVEVEFTKSQLVAGIPGGGFCIWYVMKKHWLANNTLGLAFSIQGIEMLSLGSFKIGAILLAGLFIYDIFWVFFTPVMVSVAKSFDAPIKLIFPTGDVTRPFSMLGLGDIVIPGIFVALALRFDMSRGRDKTYFTSAFSGYTVGLLVTILVMNLFQAAQPALLYIVPGVIGFLGVHCAMRGEIKPLLEFDESAAARDSTDEAQDETIGTTTALNSRGKKTD